MRKMILIILWIHICLVSTKGQIIYKPSMARSENTSMCIDKIETNYQFTTIYCTHTSSENLTTGGSISIQPEIFIQASGTKTKYNLINAEGIPLSPNKFDYSYKGQKLKFKLIFPKIEDDISYIDLIECPGDNHCFNFYGINTGLATVSKMTPPPPPPPSNESEFNKIVNEKASSEEVMIFTKVEKEASFPGGMASWRKFLQSNLDGNVPVSRNAPKGTYTAIVSFVVLKDGSINDIIPVTNYGYGMEEEVIRILLKSPKWEPAKQAGKNVKAYNRQPITFVVE